MRRAIQSFINANRQTKFFIFMGAIYLLALAWTTAQSYVRLTYSRSDLASPVIIHIPAPENK